MRATLPALPTAALAALAFVLAAGSVAAKVTGTVVDYGQVTGISRDPVPMEPGDEALSPSRPLDQRRYVDHEDVIEARLCRHFGITVRLSADPGEAIPSRVRVRVRHPLFVRPDGATGREDIFGSRVFENELGVGFGFDEPYEMQPGEWTIAVLIEGEVVAEKAFTIVLPPAGEPRSDCEPRTVS